MIPRLRSTFDVAAFIARAEWVILISAVSFVLGILPMLIGLPREVGFGIAGIGLVIATIFIIRDFYGLLGRWSSWTMRKLQFPVPLPNNVEVPGLPLIVQLSNGRVAIDPELDALLPYARNRVLWSGDEYRLPSALEELAPYVLRRSAQGRWPFNGPNVRLETNISAATLTEDNDVKLRRGSFFRGLCSNELTSWRLTQNGQPWDFNGQYLLDTQNRAFPLDQSELLNGVGVSTLAITTDDKLVIVLQSTNTQTSAGLWAPSGSGALEPRDIPGDEPRLLSDVVIGGAVRELMEEGRIPDSAIGKSLMIGYGRWLDRGAKPEFYCVTALNVDSSEIKLGLKAHPFGAEERAWTADIQLLSLNTKGLGGPVPTVESSPAWPTSGLVIDMNILEGSTSVSLSVALDALVRALRANELFLEELRIGSPAAIKP
ncbi:hypothetical protein [Salinibacterium sp. ZJ454]|uniref:hypothetical protein n=1 Tax=Salinibacterium sp. ZJ454 TaxID=2708339 RepID=UPI00141DE67D|nr:hypothetical protein [Salinibacterium sp. ZJ454]